MNDRVMKNTFAGRIRTAARSFTDTFTSRDLSIAAEIQTRKDQRRMLSTINDFCKSGELIRIKRGLYKYRTKKGSKPNIQERMWRILRSSRVVEIEDLVQLAGAKESYAIEWLQMLSRQGVVRHLKNKKWQMIKDTIDMPRNEDKAERLRNIRLKKKEALEAIQKAFEELGTVKAAIEEMDDDEKIRNN